MLSSLLFALLFTDCQTGFRYRKYNDNNWEINTGVTRAKYGTIGWYYKPAYAGRFTIDKQGNYTIKAYVGSNNGISTNSLIIRLNISGKQIDQSQFTGTLTGSTNYTATYSEYLLEGTHVYFYFEHGHTFVYSYTELSKSYEGGEFVVLNTDGECQACDEGDPCIDNRNEDELCAPYTYNYVDYRQFNGLARKFFIASAFITLLY